MKKLLSLILLFLMSVPVACSEEVSEPSLTPAPIPGQETQMTESVQPNIPAETQPAPSLLIEATTDKSYYLPGENITITISIRNVADSKIVLNPYEPEVNIRHFNGGLIENVQTIGAGSGTKALEPGQIVTFAVTWDQQSNQGQQVPNGSYVVEIDSLLNEPGDKVLAKGIRILPPQGIMEKTIEIDKMVIAADGAITMEQIKIRAAQILVQAIYTPVTPAQLETTQMSRSLDVLAEYSVDGNIPIDAGPALDQWSDNGIKLTWVIFDPVPINAKELTFRITKLGDYEGPWEFRVPLE